MTNEKRLTTTGTIDKARFVTQKTGYKDINGDDIEEGDILAGKADYLHGLSAALGSIARGIERDYVRKSLNPNVPEWMWHGNFLKSCAKNTRIIGNIFDNPELLLDSGDTYDN